jgi:hypothetical protein
MMEAVVAPQRLVRVEKGYATPEELGALVAVLLASSVTAQHTAEAAGRALSGPGWRGEVGLRFRVPHSWRAGSSAHRRAART